MTKKILIIEDDQFLRELIAKKLTQEGYEIVQAADGEEGLKQVKKTKPDLILLDLILPELDGFDVLTKIKQDNQVSHIPVIILSNLGQREDINRGMGLGAQDFLIKTYFTPTEIIEKIKEKLK